MHSRTWNTYTWTIILFLMRIQTPISIRTSTLKSPSSRYIIVLVLHANRNDWRMSITRPSLRISDSWLVKVAGTGSLNFSFQISFFYNHFTPHVIQDTSTFHSVQLSKRFPHVYLQVLSERIANYYLPSKKLNIKKRSRCNILWKRFCLYLIWVTLSNYTNFYFEHYIRHLAFHKKKRYQVYLYLPSDFSCFSTILQL